MSTASRCCVWSSLRLEILAANHCLEHWDTIPFDQRLDLLRKQWNRLQELRNRIAH